MAHLAQVAVPISLIADVQDARRRVKRIVTEATEANRDLARLETALDAHLATLNALGIRLEVDA